MIPIIDIMNIGAIAATISFLCSAAIVASQHWHGKYSMDHDLGGIQKFHTVAVPRVGGFAIVTGIIAALSLLALINPALSNTVALTDISRLMLASAPIFMAGILEDITKSVSVTLRLSASVISALLACWMLGATVDALDIWGVDTLLVITPIAVAITAFVVAGGTNAINIIDGFHGLAASAVIIMSGALGFLAWQCDDALVTQLAVLCAGATAGFLLVNYPRGRLFVGDGGAYLLGFLVSETAVLLLIRNPSINAWQVLAICSYPIIEVMVSIYRRKFIRKSNVGSADRLHLHSLIYRRLICLSLPHNHQQPWARNASVACVVAAWMLGICVLALALGDTIPGAIAVVFAQITLYMAVYARLVRGRWHSVRHDMVHLSTIPSEK